MATLTTRLSVDINNKEYERLKHLAQKHGLTIKALTLLALEPLLYPITENHLSESNFPTASEKTNSFFEELGFDF